VDWGGKVGLYWGGICFLCTVWTYFRIPEFKGRTYAEIDVLFENKVSARKFSSTYVDPFAHANQTATKTEDHTIENVETQRSDEDFTAVKA
jgi:SP family general alpha glucoside:H+ symporter-like MFS transporter